MEFPESFKVELIPSAELEKLRAEILQLIYSVRLGVRPT